MLFPPVPLTRWSLPGRFLTSACTKGNIGSWIHLSIHPIPLETPDAPRGAFDLYPVFATDLRLWTEMAEPKEKTRDAKSFSHRPPLLVQQVSCYHILKVHSYRRYKIHSNLPAVSTSKELLDALRRSQQSQLATCGHMTTRDLLNPRWPKVDGFTSPAVPSC